MRGGLLWRGIRWRFAGSLLLLAAATLAFAAGIVAPPYLRAAGDSVVRATVTAALGYQSGVSLGGGAGLATGPEITRAQQRVTGGQPTWFGTPTMMFAAGAGVQGPLPTVYPGSLFYETD